MMMRDVGVPPHRHFEEYKGAFGYPRHSPHNFRGQGGNMMWINRTEYNSLVQASDRERQLSHERVRREERIIGYMKQISDLRSQNDRLYEKIRDLQSSKQQASCSCGNLLYTMEKTECGRMGYIRNDPRAEPSNMENGSMYCVCLKCRRINKHRFGILL